MLLPIHPSIAYQKNSFSYKTLFPFPKEPSFVCQQKILKNKNFLLKIELFFHVSLPSPLFRDVALIWPDYSKDMKREEHEKWKSA